MLTPTVRSVMTPAPKVIEAQADTATAHALMEELDVRHLPVMDRDRLVGVLSERDLRGEALWRAAAAGDLSRATHQLQEHILGAGTRLAAAIASQTRQES